MNYCYTTSLISALSCDPVQRVWTRCLNRSSWRITPIRAWCSSEPTPTRPTAAASAASASEWAEPTPSTSWLESRGSSSVPRWVLILAHIQWTFNFVFAHVSPQSCLCGFPVGDRSETDRDAVRLDFPKGCHPEGCRHSDRERRHGGHCGVSRTWSGLYFLHR